MAVVALRGSEGVSIVNGMPPDVASPIHICDKGSNCKVISFSQDGLLLAWATPDSVCIMNTYSYAVRHQLPQAKVSDVKFSPLGKMLATWMQFFTGKVDADVKDRNGEIPNMLIWDTVSGEPCKKFIQKKRANWLPQWSCDEVVCCLLINNEILFYENNNFDTIKHRLQLPKLISFSLAKNPAPYTVSAYVSGSKGQPSYVRVYQYPNMHGSNSSIANKSFYKADRLSMFWNDAGSSLVILTSTESSESSYYGEQCLYYITLKDDSCVVPLDKKGPVYSVMWSPTDSEFCVVFGYIPSKAALFNLKCEMIYDFGNGPRNTCFYNPHGNNATNTTNFLWSPDGEHILTATVSPRLRVDNNYKLWHYTGTLLCEVLMPDKQQLWDVLWRPAIPGLFKEKPIKYKPSEPGIFSIDNVKREVYRPPHARTENHAPLAAFDNSAPDKPFSKNKKKREARKAKIEKQQAEPENNLHNNSHFTATVTLLADTDSHCASVTDDEIVKKERSIRKKLQSIDKLKEQQKSGKQLELNQLEKLKMETVLLNELEDLTLR